MELSLGFSTCPNDTFIFDAMINGKIETEGLSFNIVMADVEQLNKRAFEGNIDITKISYHAFSYVASNYKLLNSGSALGRGNGPLLISKRQLHVDEIKDLKVAIPGKFTTANLLFQIFFPESVQKVELIFSEIEDAILQEKVDAGVIIHENRFTFQEKGLHKIVDLGEKWENETGYAIPLGGIAVHRKHPPELQQKIDRVLRKSIEFAFQNPESGMEFIKLHAQEMKEDIIRKHIQLYVNQFTLDLGTEGKNAVYKLFGFALKKGVIDLSVNDIFVE